MALISDNLPVHGHPVPEPMNDPARFASRLAYWPAFFLKAHTGIFDGSFAPDRQAADPPAHPLATRAKRSPPRKRAMSPARGIFPASAASPAA
jgi:hypothetical protein